MAGFNDIVGHQRIIEHLKNAIEYGKVSHAYILEGEDGIGKLTLAKAFAMALQCKSGKSEPCMECQSCVQSVTDNNPDIIMVGHEKSGIISVNDVREQLNGDVMIKPYSNRYKIYIINDAQKLNTAAQNAILKTIEEPPEYAIIMLLTTNCEMFLPTIMSRCIRLNLLPLSYKEVYSYLTDKLKLAKDVSEFAASFAQGRLGKAIEMASSEEYEKLRESALWVVKYVDEMTTSELISAFKSVGQFKNQIDSYIDFLMVWYKDVLLYKATANIDAVTFREELSYIREQASKHTYEGLENILNAFNKAKDRLKANVNFDLVIELMVLTIKEN